MRTIMARTYKSSFSFSKRNFQWVLRKGSNEGEGDRKDEDVEGENAALAFTSSSTYASSSLEEDAASAAKKRASSATAEAVSRLRSALTAAIVGRRGRLTALGSRVTGTLFGYRRGHVNLAFQVDTRSRPVVLIELATPTSTLVREMASGLVRVALECERKGSTRDKQAAARLVEEPLWRAYCNGKRCGYAVRRECGPADWKVLRAVEPVSMGAGVIPGDNKSDSGSEGDIMYMRARFERVVGSKDSEAFYMMNPDGNGGPELSVYFLRV